MVKIKIMKTTVNLLERPLEELTRKDLKAAIQQKFESVVRFSELAGFRLNPLMNALNSQSENDEFIKEVYEKARGTENAALSWEISEEKRVELRNKINKDYKFVKNFVEKHPEFQQVWVSGILNGGVSKITKKVRKLANVLNVEI